MSILKQIMTAIKGGTRELGEAIVDSQGTRIFEQEIEDSKEHLKKAKLDLTDVMAKQMQSSRKVSIIQNDIDNNEALVLAALEKKEEPLALEIAMRVADLEQDKLLHEEINLSYESHIANLKLLMEKTERQLKDYERQLAMVKTTENVQKATKTIKSTFGSSNTTLLSAKESLHRIRQKQEEIDDQDLALEQMETEASGKQLEEKMKKVGLIKTQNSAEAVLERIKTKN